MVFRLACSSGSWDFDFGVSSPSPATPAAVFLSYAREDSESARSIADAARLCRAIVQGLAVTLSRRKAHSRLASLGMSLEFWVWSWETM